MTASPSEDNLLAVSLGNLNPVAHVPLMLCNLTRVEKAERWAIYDCMSGGVAALMKAIDAERLAVMAGFGIAGRSIEEHFHRSFGVPRGELAGMAAAVHAQRGGPAGPVTLATRFILEDVPYGLVFFSGMGRIALVPTPIIDACITLCATVYARDFGGENTLLGELCGETTDPAQLLALARDGYSLNSKFRQWVTGRFCAHYAIKSIPASRGRNTLETIPVWAQLALYKPRRGLLNSRRAATRPAAHPRGRLPA